MDRIAKEKVVSDLTKKFDGNLSKAFEKSNTKFFVISFTSDWLYPTSESRDIVIALNAIGSNVGFVEIKSDKGCLLYTSPSPRDRTRSRMPSSA